MTHDTIFAVASAPGRGGVAVIRISGPQAGPALQTLTAGKPLPAPRLATLRHLQDPQTGELIDHALALWFPGPNSFTGEDVVELHIHGGRAVSTALLTVLTGLPDCRMAEPGEFSRRAFEHDKMDLTEAEAIADLVDAETAAQRRQALRQMDGALGSLYHGWADQLVKTLAHLEAYLDFPDEPLPPELERAHQALIANLIAELSSHLSQGARGQRLRDGIRIAIVGEPNAGKSSLFNQLAAREAAIVSPQPGTTRDIIEAALDIAGYPVILQDTAGLRDSADMIEAEGVRRADAAARQADLVLFVYDARQLIPALYQDYQDQPHLLIANKADIAKTGANGIAVSAANAQIEALHSALAVWLDQNYGLQEQPSLTRLRHQQALEQTLSALRRSQTAPSLDLVAEDLRLSVRHLGQITGKISVEEMLDIIFRDFCIGK